MAPDERPINYSGHALIAAPGREIPPKVLEGICAYCTDRPVITELYLYAMALLSDEAREGPRLTIGLRLAERLTDQDEQTLCEGLAPAAPPPESGYGGLLVTVLRDDADVEIVRRHVLPLYRRGDPPHAWLLQRTLLLPRTEETELFPTGSGQHSASGTIGLPVISQDGVRSLPAFTTEAEFTRWRPGGEEWIGLPATTLLAAFLETPADRIVVDNMSPHAFAVDRGAAQRLLAIAAAPTS